MPGILGKKLSIETRKKISDALKGRLPKSHWKKGHPMFNHTTNKGKHWKLSEEARKNISRGLLGNTHTRGKRGLWKMPEEMKKERSILMIGNKLTLGRKHSKETKEKMSRVKILNPNRHFKETSIELKIESELKNRGIIFQKQVPLCGVAIVDFYLPEYRVVIQCDGCYYHGCLIHCPKSKFAYKRGKDSRQDFVLTFNGFNIYRFWEHEINNSVKKCIDRLALNKKD